MFSLLWSEHCAYKHSRKLLRRLPTEGERVLMGPGRERRRGLGRRRLGGRLQGRVPQPPERGRAVPGRRDRGRRDPARRVRARRPADRGARLAALRRARLASARATCSTTSSPGSATTATRSACRPSAARSTSRRPTSRTASSTRCASASPAADEMVRAAAAGVGNAVVLMGASTGRDGIGGASVLASAELEGGDDSKRPTVQIGDPFEEAKLLECCLELLARGPAGLAPGPRRGGAHLLGGRDGLERRRRDRHRRRPGAAARGRHGAVRDHGLRVAGADARRGRARQGRRGARRVRAVGDGRRRDRRGHRTAAIFRVLRDGEVVGEMPVAALVDDCPLYDLEPEPSRTAGSTANARRRSSARRTTPATILLRAACLAEHRQQALGVRAVRLDRAARTRCAGPRRPTPRCCICPRPARRSRSRSTATAAGSPATPTRARSRRCSSARRTSPASGAEPLGLTNCLNFGNPEKPAVAWQLDRSTQGLADACEALGVPVVGGNVSLYNETDEGPIYPTPVVGMVGELPDPERRRRRWRSRDGDAIALCGPFSPSLAGSELAKLRGELGPGLPSLPIGEVARGDRRSSATRSRAGRVARRPRRQRRRPRLRARRDGDRRRGRASRSTSTRWSRRAAARARRRCSARGRAASSLAGRRGPSSRRWPRRRRRRVRRSARAGGERIAIAAAEAEARRRARRRPSAPGVVPRRAASSAPAACLSDSERAGS